MISSYGPSLSDALQAKATEESAKRVEELPVRHLRSSDSPIKFRFW